MSATADTMPPPSADAEPSPSLGTILLAGLTANGDETPALSVLCDTHRELEALTDLLGLDLDGEPLERGAMIVLLEGIERRLSAGVELVRRELSGAKGAE